MKLEQVVAPIVFLNGVLDLLMPFAVQFAPHLRLQSLFLSDLATADRSE
jgi:hypothetical protein